MLLAKWISSILYYLNGLPPVTATFNTSAVINVFVESELDQESLEPARKKQKTGMERVKWLTKCNDKFSKPVHHGKALRLNVTMKKQTLAAILNDTNKGSHLHRKTTHPENYFQ